ncbi:hypothetical protein JCM6882_002940 [Rhodosporidiobolus microsporus]
MSDTNAQHLGTEHYQRRASAFEEERLVHLATSFNLAVGEATRAVEAHLPSQRPLSLQGYHPDITRLAEERSRWLPSTYICISPRLTPSACRVPAALDAIYIDHLQRSQAVRKGVIFQNNKSGVYFADASFAFARGEGAEAEETTLLIFQTGAAENGGAEEAMDVGSERVVFFLLEEVVSVVQISPSRIPLNSADGHNLHTAPLEISVDLDFFLRTAEGRNAALPFYQATLTCETKGLCIPQQLLDGNRGVAAAEDNLVPFLSGEGVREVLCSSPTQRFGLRLLSASCSLASSHPSYTRAGQAATGNTPDPMPPSPSVPPSRDLPFSSLTITFRCTSVPSNDPASPSATHIASISVPRPSSLSLALSAARSSFPHLALFPTYQVSLERQFKGAAPVTATETLWRDFAFLPSEKGAVYLVKVAGEEEDVKPFIKREEEEDALLRVKREESVDDVPQRARKRRRGEDDWRSEGAPSPQPWEPSVAAQEEDEDLDGEALMEEEEETPALGAGSKEVVVILPSPFQPLRLRYNESTTLLDLRRVVQAETEFSLHTNRHRWTVLGDGKSFWGHGATLSSLGFLTRLSVVERAGVEEPGLHLFPPSPLSPVRVTFRPSRDFPIRVHRPYFRLSMDEPLSWTVSAFPDGTFVSDNGEPHPQFSVMPSALSFQREACRWSTLRLNTLNSAFSPGHSLCGTISTLLQQFGLPPDMRAEFLKILENQVVPRQHYIFRFLRHAEYNRILPLDIDPPPDVVSRIFLLFKVMGPRDGSSERYCRGEPVDWPKEIGLDLGKMQDESLVRALEWGLYEVRD